MQNLNPPEPAFAQNRPAGAILTYTCSPAVHRDGNERPTFPFHEMYISPGFCSNGGVPEEHLPEAARQHIRDSEVVDPDVIQSGGHSGENVTSYWPFRCCEKGILLGAIMLDGNREMESGV